MDGYKRNNLTIKPSLEVFLTPIANVLYSPIVCFEVGLFFQIIF